MKTNEIDSSSDYQWFIEPLDQHTNQALAGWLAEENFHRNSLCEQGKIHQLWQVDSYQFINYLKSCRDLRFEIFNRRGKFGKLRRVTWLTQSQKKRNDLKRIIENAAKLDK